MHSYNQGKLYEKSGNLLKKRLFIKSSWAN